MREIRLHVDMPLAAGDVVTLPEAAARHASTVLRVRAGARLSVFNGSGGEYAAEVVRASRAGVELRLLERHAHERESPLRVTLVQGVSRGERMDLTVQKSVELGVAVIQPLLCERSVVRLHGERAERRVAHWRAVAASACEQCGRDRLPEIAPLLDFETWLPQMPAKGLRLTLSPHAGRPLSALAPPPPEHGATLVVGPEGGLSEAESAMLAAAGFTPLRLGPRVLRTETAALAAVALLQCRFGDLDAPADPGTP